MITFLTIFIIVLKAIEVIFVATLIILSIDMAIHHKKEAREEQSGESYGRHTPQAVAKLKAQELLRKEKEAAAHEGLFEGPYVRGFNPAGELFYRGSQVITEKGLVYYKMMDEIADSAIFENTKEI